MTKHRKNLDYINLLYVIGVILVVLGHSTINYFGNWGMPNTRDSETAKLINKYVYTFHMPLFFFLSGYVFSFNKNKGKYLDTLKFVVNKFNRLIIPYFVIGLIYVFPMKLAVGDYNLNNYLQSVYRYLFLGYAPGQLWYLISLFTIFFIYYFFQKHFNDQLNSKAFRFLFIGLLIWIHVNSINDEIKFLQISNTLRYLIFFHIGYMTYREKIGEKILRHPILLLLVHYGAFWLNMQLDNNVPKDTVMIVNVSLVVRLIIAVLGIFAYLSLAKTLTSKFPKIMNFNLVSVIRNYNLEIYLFHQQIIVVFLYFQEFRDLHPALVVLISLFSSIAISVPLGIIYRKFMELLLLWMVSVLSHMQNR